MKRQDKRCRMQQSQGYPGIGTVEDAGNSVLSRRWDCRGCSKFCYCGIGIVEVQMLTLERQTLGK